MKTYTLAETLAATCPPGFWFVRAPSPHPRTLWVLQPQEMCTKDGELMTAPEGFREVPAAEFWRAVDAAGPRFDPMPSHENPNATRWKTRSGDLWGWQYPGYANFMGCDARGQHQGRTKPKRYFLKGPAA